MIKNIVFDMGQVLIRFDPWIFLNRIPELTEEEKTVLLHEVFKSVEWVMTDHGLLTVEEATEILGKKLPEKLQKYAAELVLGWPEPLLTIDGMVDLVKELHDKGYRLFLLSNAGNNQPVYWQKYAGAGYFEDTMISCTQKLIKPDHRIYEALTGKHDLNPEECLFIDDSPVNVEGAVCCGWQGIVFHGDHEELRAKMKKMNIL